MRHTALGLLFAAALVAAFPLRGSAQDACNQALATAGYCGLKGPVRTAERWYSIPNNNDPVVREAEAVHTFLMFSADGVRTEIRKENSGVLQSVMRSTTSDGGRTVLVISDSNSPDGHLLEHKETTVYYDENRHELRRQFLGRDGKMQDTQVSTFDPAGHLLSRSNYSWWTGHGEFAGRTDYQYDDRGRVTRETYFDANGIETSHLEYAYPAANRKTTLEFLNSFPRDPQASASTPTWVLDATLDKEGRPVDTQTTAPGVLKEGWGCGDCPQPGRVARRYDEHGDLVEEDRYDSDGNLARFQTLQYNAVGNIISERNGDDASSTEDHFDYEYDSYGNWTRKTEYRLNPDGTRRVFRIDYQKLAYYP